MLCENIGVQGAHLTFAGVDTVELAAPVTVGQVVVADLLGTGVDVVATKSFA